MSKKNFTQQMIVISLLIGMEIIFTRFLSIQLLTLRIGFGFLPVAICAMLYGKYWAGGAYVVGDIIGGILFPSGPFFPGFTLSAFITGFVYGIFLHKREVKITNAALAAFCTLLICTIFLNTIWLQILYGKAFFVLIIPRLGEAIAMFFVQTALMVLVYNTVVSKIQKRIQ